MERRWIIPAIFGGLFALLAFSLWREFREEAQNRELLRSVVRATSGVATFLGSDGNVSNRNDVVRLNGRQHARFAEVVRTLRPQAAPSDSYRNFYMGTLTYSNATHRVVIQIDLGWIFTATVFTPDEARRMGLNYSEDLREFILSLGQE